MPRNRVVAVLRRLGPLTGPELDEALGCTPAATTEALEPLLRVYDVLWDPDARKYRARNR